MTLYSWKAYATASDAAHGRHLRGYVSARSLAEALRYAANRHEDALGTRPAVVEASIYR